MTILTNASDLSNHYLAEFVEEATRKISDLTAEQLEAAKAAIKPLTDKAAAVIFAVVDHVDTCNKERMGRSFNQTMGLIETLAGDTTRYDFQHKLSAIDPRLCEM